MIDKILNPNTKVGDIFPNDVTQAKNIYRDLCKKYHPDTFADDITPIWTSGKKTSSR